MPADAFASDSERSHTEFQDKHGHSEVVGFRCLPAIVAEVTRIKESTKDFNSQSDVYRAIIYEGLKVLQDRLESPDYIPNRSIGFFIDATRDMENKKLRDDLIVTLEKWVNSYRGKEQQRVLDKLRDMTKIANMEGDEWLRDKIQAIIVTYS